jgi:hypothetical protein
VREPLGAGSLDDHRREREDLLALGQCGCLEPRPDVELADAEAVFAERGSCERRKAAEAADREVEDQAGDAERPVRVRGRVRGSGARVVEGREPRERPRRHRRGDVDVAPARRRRVVAAVVGDVEPVRAEVAELVLDVRGLDVAVGGDERDPRAVGLHPGGQEGEVLVLILDLDQLQRGASAEVEERAELRARVRRGRGAQAEACRFQALALAAVEAVAVDVADAEAAGARGHAPPAYSDRRHRVHAGGRA